MALTKMALAAIVGGAAAVPLLPGPAWAQCYSNCGGFPAPTGGGGGSETVGHSGGANGDQPPMGVTNDRPAPGSPETVTQTSTACAPGSPVTVQLTYISPTSTPVSFGPGSSTAGSSGGFAITGNIPSDAAPGTWVIFATCNDAGGNPFVYTVTIVVPNPPQSSGLRTSVVGSEESRSASSGGSGSGGSSGSGSGAGSVKAAPAGSSAGGAVWTPPVNWGTPALRALVAPAVNAAAVSAPVVLSESHPVVAHTGLGGGTTAPWRDGVEGVVGLVGLAGLVRLGRRHQGRRRNRWNSKRRMSLGSHRRRSPVARRVFGSKPKGMW